MSIAGRLVRAFTGVAFIIAVGGAVTMWQFSQVVSQTRRIAAVDDRLLDVYRVRDDISVIRRELMSLSEQEDAGRFMTGTQFLRTALSDDLEHAFHSFEESGAPVPDTLRALGDSVTDQLDAMQRLANVNDWTAVRLRIENQIEDISEATRTLVNHVGAGVRDERMRALAEVDAARERARLIITGTALASLVASLALGVHVTRSITIPLSRLKRAAHKLAARDFNTDVEVEGKDELAELSEAFNVASRELRRSYVSLERSNQDLERFAYAVSHDLQEPLRNISAFSALLKQRYADALGLEGQEFLAFLMQASSHMHELIAGILEYSRVTTAKEQETEDLDAEQIVRTVLNNLRVMVEQTRASVTYEPLPRISGTRVQLIQLFQNLIANAIKYQRENTPAEVRVSARREDSMWCFCVADNGVGIPPKDQERIFNMFQQLHHGKRGGVGIGLAIAKRIVEQQGGRIWVESKNGDGSAFYFTLSPARQG